MLERVAGGVAGVVPAPNAATMIVLWSSGRSGPLVPLKFDGVTTSRVSLAGCDEPHRKHDMASDVRSADDVDFSGRRG